MPNPLRAHRGLTVLLGVVVAAVLAGSGWLLVGAMQPRSHANPSPPAATSPSGSPVSAPSGRSPAPTSGRGVQPAQLVIPSLQVQAPIEDKGIDSHNQMEAPDRPFDVAWYPFTAMPGSGGNAVFAGHKDFAGVGPAVFWKLGQLTPGDVIDVTSADQGQLHYQVTQTWDYTLATIPMASVLDQSGGDQITLITCAGSYTRSAGYDHRLVVRAKRAD